tara:strand:+ start:7472 stop:7987 length:516 start_codon:yes stop_codon:yes gene_type:complete
MATNTLIQKLFAVDETGVGEDSTQDSNRQQIETFRCTEVISAGATVSLDLSQANNGLKALCVQEADGTDYIPIGVYASANDSAVGDFVDITIRGIVEEALTNGSGVAIAVGDRLTYSTSGKLIAVPDFRTDLGDGTGTTTGTVAQQSIVCAIAMEIQAGDGKSRVFVLNNY